MAYIEENIVDDMMNETKKKIKKDSRQEAVFSKEERAAMQEYVREKIREKKRNGGKADEENIVLEKIAKMVEPDRTMSKRVHTIIKSNAPSLSPRLWYGMPAYSNEEGKVVCYFQDARKFKTRYATLGFSDKAHLDEDNMWPVVFALKKLTDAEEAKIVALLKKALG